SAGTGKAIAFTGSASGSPGPFTYLWDFGDSQSSTQQSPSHAYAVAGGYNARLTVTDSATGCASAASSPIALTITPGPALVAGAIPTASCPNKDIVFSASATGGTGTFTWAWDFGDSQSSTQQNPT